ncbi:hypothetical protein B296_00009271 [Ensete ventricosum]|uniref:Uncharacterized protein n=1 Tax=Ensete ventricosum TaxID=4639 RepID=A0A427AM54_ENSVE|nr:hypothetical protein B296_00009271 [Ensete ventricosum]
MTSTLTGFTGDAIAPIDVVTLLMTFGEELRTKTLMVSFMVVELLSTYNVIIGRPTLNKLRAVVSTCHRNMKFLTSAGTRKVKIDPRESRQCYLAATTIPKKGKRETPVLDPREPDRPDVRLEPTKLILEVPLEGDRPEKTVWKSFQSAPATVTNDGTASVNTDVITWSPPTMIRSARTVMPPTSTRSASSAPCRSAFYVDANAIVTRQLREFQPIPDVGVIKASTAPPHCRINSDTTSRQVALSMLYICIGIEQLSSNERAA